MDLSALLGISIGIIVIIGTLLSESHSVSVIIQPTAALIVFGGTFGAAITNFQLPLILSAFKEVFSSFSENRINSRIIIKQLIDLANIVRQEGILIVQEVIPSVEDNFLKKSLQLILDTNDENLVKEMLNSEIEFEEDKLLVNPHVFETLGGYAPTFGIIGAVLGLIQVMGNITNPSELGYGISTAFVATIYGVGAANLVFLPLAGKLRMQAREQIILKRVIAEGVLSIHRCENPAITKEKLLSYLK